MISNSYNQKKSEQEVFIKGRASSAESLIRHMIICKLISAEEAKRAIEQAEKDLAEEDM